MLKTSLDRNNRIYRQKERRERSYKKHTAGGMEEVLLYYIYNRIESTEIRGVTLTATAKVRMPHVLSAMRKSSKHKAHLDGW